MDRGLAAHYLALYRVEKEIFATDNRCTHGLAPLCDGYLDGHIIECPMHQGRFDVRTGRCVAAPVTKELRTYPVRVVDGFVEVLLETS